MSNPFLFHFSGISSRESSPDELEDDILVDKSYLTPLVPQIQQN